MKCAQIRDRLSDHLEGDLPAAMHTSVVGHLADCAGCAQEFSELRDTVTLLRGLPVPESPETLVPQVMRLIRAGETRPSLWQGLRAGLIQLGTPRLALPLGAIAALTLYVAVGGDSGVSLVRPRVAERVVTEASPIQPEVTPGQPEATPVQPELRAEVVASARARRVVPETKPRFPAASQGLVAVAELASAGSAGSGPRFAPSRQGPLPGDSRRLERVRPPGAAMADLDKAERGRIQLDRRLDLLLERPAVFVQLMTADSVAAQELWMVELAERAIEREIDAEVIDALRNSADPGARGMVEELSRAVARAHQRSVSNESGSAKR